MDHLMGKILLIVIWVGLGIIFLSIGLLVKKIHNVKVQACDGTTTATIKGYKKVDSDNGYTYAPVYQYIVNGNTIEKASSISYGKEKYEVGTQVVLHYSSMEPEKFYVEEEESSISKVYVGFKVAGILMIVVGCGLAIASFFFVL